MSVCAAATALVNWATIPRLHDPAHDEPGNDRAAEVTEPLTVCIPARNEFSTLPLLLADLRSQIRCPTMQVLIYDDESTDGTAGAAASILRADPRFRLIVGHGRPPAGWTGKAAACDRLSTVARNSAVARSSAAGGPDGIIVFMDADVRIAPWAMASAAAELRRTRVSLLSPWPYQVAIGTAEKVVQPLLCWTWMASVPVRLANRVPTPPLAVACGQFLMFDAHDYYRIDGHRGVATSATEDLDIARTLRRAGCRTAVIAAGRSVQCRMYTGPKPLFVGYTRWLWSVTATGCAAGAITAALTCAFVVPPAAALLGCGRTRSWGVLGWTAASVSRFAARRSEGSPESLLHDAGLSAAHPVSAVCFLVLSSASSVMRFRNRLTWKDRPWVGVPGVDR